MIKILQTQAFWFSCVCISKAALSSCSSCLKCSPECWCCVILSASPRMFLSSLGTQNTLYLFKHFGGLKTFPTSFRFHPLHDHQIHNLFQHISTVINRFCIFKAWCKWSRYIYPWKAFVQPIYVYFPSRPVQLLLVHCCISLFVLPTCRSVWRH